MSRRILDVPHVVRYSRGRFNGHGIQIDDCRLDADLALRAAFAIVFDAMMRDSSVLARVWELLRASGASLDVVVPANAPRVALELVEQVNAAGRIFDVRLEARARYHEQAQAYADESIEFADVERLAAERDLPDERLDGLVDPFNVRAREESDA